MSPFDSPNLGKKVTLLLAHGAGAGAHSDFMQGVRERLIDTPIDPIRFNFPYMQQMVEEQRRRPPTALPTLISSYQEIIESIGTQIQRPLWIGGKSMGGRVATHLIDHPKIAGVIALGYPFHPPGKPDKLRTDHLCNLKKPLHILQGERDTFGTQIEVNRYRLERSIHLHWIKDGDHSFKPRKSSGVPLEQNLDEAAKMITSIILS